MQLNRKSFLLAATAFLLSGCGLLKPVTPGSPSTLITELENIITLAGSAVGLLGGLGISPTLLSQIAGYLQALGVAVGDISDALSAGTVLTKASAVIQAIANLVMLPVFSGVIPASILTILQAIVAAVSVFLSAVGTASAPSAKLAVNKSDAGSLAIIKSQALAVIKGAQKFR